VQQSRASVTKDGGQPTAISLFSSEEKGKRGNRRVNELSRREEVNIFGEQGRVNHPIGTEPSIIKMMIS
jgi:hypothetical protein